MKVDVKRLAAVMATVFAVLSPSVARADLPELLFGVWALDPAASTQNSTRFKRTTCRIEPWEDGIRVIYDLVGDRGGVIHLEWTGRFDGADYPVQGVDYVLTNAYTRIDDRSYQVVIKVDGQVAATARTSISPDGRNLTTETDERMAGGEEVRTTVVYRKR